MLFLTPHVHAAACGDDLVLLDVARDSYFCLPDAAAGLNLESGARALPGVAEDLAADLVNAGLATLEDGEAGGAWRPVAPTNDLSRLPTGCAAGLGDTAAFAASLAAMSVSFRGRSLAAMLTHVQTRRTGFRAAPRVSAVARAQMFRSLLPWAPVQGACLFQAFLLLDYLARAGIDADWVFGVRTWPFMAHCWVQDGTTVLNDSVDRVSAYAPILVA